MRYFTVVILAALFAACGVSGPANLPRLEEPRPRPESFPARIWAACDFELLRNDVVWGARIDSSNVPAYPANRYAAAARETVPGISQLNVVFTRYPRAEDSSRVYFRYFTDGDGTLEIRLFNSSRGAWHSVTLTALQRGEWAEAVADFASVGDEFGGGPLASGERVSEVMIILHGPGGLLIDDLICYKDGGDSGRTQEKFPRRVIMLWAFDPVAYYHPWTHTDFRVNHKHRALERDWGAGEALARETIHDNQRSQGDNDYDRVKRIRLIIDPPQQVGEHTRMLYNYWLENVRRVQPMIFDLTDMDNRHLGLESLSRQQWRTQVVDFTRDGIKNDGNQTEFEAGSLVDDVFFLAWPDDPREDFTLLVDDIVLYDAYE